MRQEDLRSIWSEESGPSLPEEPAETIPPTSEPPPGTATLDNIAAPRAKRNRQWEKNHPTASYRGVPSTLNQEVSEIATRLGVTRDEVMRAFLEYALELYTTGELQLSPRPGPRRLTLFPPGENPAWKINKTKPAPPQHQPRKRKKNNPSPVKKRWELVTSFRIPKQLKHHIRKTARDNGEVSPGEVVTAFLTRALDDYKAGILVLNPIAAKNTLYPDG